MNRSNSSSAAFSQAEPTRLRRAERLETNCRIPALMRIGQGQLPFSVTFIDVSAAGACIETHVALAVGATTHLVMLKKSLSFTVIRRQAKANGTRFIYGLQCKEAAVDLTNILGYALAL